MICHSLRVTHLTEWHANSVLIGFADRDAITMLHHAYSEQDRDRELLFYGASTAKVIGARML